MEIDLSKYGNEIVDFLNVDTLRAIDYGTLDLSGVKNVELKEVFCYLEELLSVELVLNYMQNCTGIFRVHLFGEFWCYCEGEYVISAYSACELKQSVVSSGRIWYVFDEDSARKHGGKSL